MEFVLNTISLGSLSALLALGLVFVYGILKLVNFAYGEYVMVGGYALFVTGSMQGVPWWVTAVIAVLMAALVSYLTELAAFRPVIEHYREPYHARGVRIVVDVDPQWLS